MMRIVLAIGVAFALSGCASPLFDPTAPSANAPVMAPAPAIATGSIAPPPQRRRGPVALGDKGADVRKLQAALSVRGFDVEPDGDFGPRTEDAVITFQMVNDLTPDGVVGRQTKIALGMY